MSEKPRCDQCCYYFRNPNSNTGLCWKWRMEVVSTHFCQLHLKKSKEGR